MILYSVMISPLSYYCSKLVGGWWVAYHALHAVTRICPFNQLNIDTYLLSLGNGEIV